MFAGAAQADPMHYLYRRCSCGRPRAWRCSGDVITIIGFLGQTPPWHSPGPTAGTPLTGGVVVAPVSRRDLAPHTSPSAYTQTASGPAVFERHRL